MNDAKFVHKMEKSIGQDNISFHWRTVFNQLRYWGHDDFARHDYTKKDLERYFNLNKDNRIEWDTTFDRTIGQCLKIWLEEVQDQESKKFTKLCIEYDINPVEAISKDKWEALCKDIWQDQPKPVKILAREKWFDYFLQWLSDIRQPNKKNKPSRKKKIQRENPPAETPANAKQPLATITEELPMHIALVQRNSFLV